MKPTLLVILLGVLLISACSPQLKPTGEPLGGASTTSIQTSTPTSAAATTPIAASTGRAGATGVEALFSYDSSAPFDVVVVSREEQEGVIIEDITFRADNSEFAQASQGRIVAYLVSPAGSGSHAGILFLHQLEGLQDRKEFLDEAVLLAKQGVVSVLPNGILPWRVKFTGTPDQDLSNIAQQVIELRRTLDLLLSQSGVDPDRVGCVGHDYGAMYAGLLVSIDHRVKACVLMTPDGTFSHWALTYHMMPAPADVSAYQQGLAMVDPIKLLPLAAPTDLLFQFGETDSYIPQATAEALYDASSQPKEVRWYPAGHDLNQVAADDRLAWLADKLQLQAAP
jgi:dienelactone hydrolase